MHDCCAILLPSPEKPYLRALCQAQLPVVGSYWKLAMPVVRMIPNACILTTWLHCRKSTRARPEASGYIPSFRAIDVFLDVS